MAVNDHLQILSNGRYKSVEHRAVVHPTKERMSAAVFHQPCQDYATVGPLPELVKKDGEALYGSISYVDFIKGYFAAKLDGRSYLESLKS
jgi:isopenicillin N synthase-like dioxygenase